MAKRRTPEEKAWLQGFATACSIIFHSHGETVATREALGEAGIDLAAARRLGLDDYDMEAIRKILSEHEKHARWLARQQKKAPK